MILSSNSKREQQFLPGAGVRAPLDAGVLGVPSSTEEARALLGVLLSVIRQTGGEQESPEEG